MMYEFSSPMAGEVDNTTFWFNNFFYIPDKLFGWVVLFLARVKLGEFLYDLGYYLHKKLNGIEED